MNRAPAECIGNPSALGASDVLLPFISDRTPTSRSPRDRELEPEGYTDYFAVPAGNFSASEHQRIFPGSTSGGLRLPCDPPSFLARRC